MLLRIVTLAYAAVFAVEGIGLWMEKRWAEWLTTIITASLIPLEAWEIVLRPTIGKALILLANVAVVGYLVWHVVDEVIHGANGRAARPRQRFVK